MRTHYKNRVLRGLNDADLAEVLKVCRTIPLEFGRTLNAVGEPVETVFFPESGVISLVTHYREGTTVEMANVGCESCTGFAPALGHDRALTTELVQIPGQASAMAVSDFRRLLDTIPMFAQAVNSNIYAMMHQVMVSGACNARHDTTERLARWLLTMYDRTTNPEMNFTQDFLAEILSVRRATISEAASQLRDVGAIRYARGRIELVDIDALSTASCECYDLVASAYRGTSAGMSST